MRTNSGSTGWLPFARVSGRSLALAIVGALSVSIMPGLTPPSAIITTVGAVKRLSRHAVAQNPPVTLQGVLTLNVPDQYLTFLQDGTGAVYLQLPDTRTAPIPAGKKVEVRGVVKPGLFAPSIKVTAIRVLGDGRRPRAIPIPIGAAGTGRLDATLVRVRGIVRAFREDQHKDHPGKPPLRLALMTPAGRISLTILHPENSNPENLIGATVEAEGPRCGKRQPKTAAD